MREAALGSVRDDPGLHQLVPYLNAWAGEQASSLPPPPSFPSLLRVSGGPAPDAG